MRTTVTLDADVERLLKDEAHRSRKSFKAVLNESVREVLRPRSGKRPGLLAPRHLDFLPGVDPRRLSELADDLEVDAHLEVMNRGK